MSDVVALPHRTDGLEQPVDGAIAQLAGRQYGVAAYWQLTAMGLTRGAIEMRVRQGRLHRVHKGSYAVGHPALGRRGHWMAAVLSCGPDAVLSHRDAAALWGIRSTARSMIDVTVPGRSRHKHPGVDVHLPRHLDPEDVTEHEQIPVTTVARTLLDLAETVPKRNLERAFAEAERLQLLDLRRVDEVLSRARGRRGARPLRRVLSGYLEAPWTRSELEDRFLKLCRSARVPKPSVNAFIEEFEVDLAWPEQRLIVELDGYAFHRTRDAFQRDRARDAVLQLAGYRVWRVTHRDLQHEPQEVTNKLRQFLGVG